MVYYPIPLHKMRVFSGRCIVNGELSEAERAAEEVLSLPMEPLMQYKEAAPIIGELRRDRTRDIYKAHIQP